MNGKGRRKERKIRGREGNFCESPRISTGIFARAAVRRTFLLRQYIFFKQIWGMWFVYSVLWRVRSELVAPARRQHKSHSLDPPRQSPCFGKLLAPRQPGTSNLKC